MQKLIRKQVRKCIVGAILLLTLPLAAQAKATTVSANQDAKVYEKRSVSSDVVAIMPKDTQRKVLSANGKWVKLRMDGETGYVRQKYLTTLITEKKLYAAENCILRELPTTASDKLSTLPQDSALVVDGVSGSWYRTTVNGQKGFVAKSRLTAVDPNYDVKSYTEKCQQVFGKDYYDGYTSETKAKKHQKTITVKVWRLKSDGKTKYSSTASLTVNKAIASDVRKVFQEIYDSDEQFPIQDVGGYSWRGSSSSSEHCEGVAIDINADSNYMVRRDGTVLSGSHWLPGEDPYSIPANSEIVRIFAKYGFRWGGLGWSTSYDYMHFSYFGT